MNFTKIEIPSSSLSLSMGQQFLAVLNVIAILFPVFLIIFTFRGFIQATIARLMGDTTAQRNGFLTLNPLAHIDIFGLSFVLLVFFVLGGLLYGTIPQTLLFILIIILGVRWTIPIPIDDQQFKNYRLGGILTSLSGPLSNFFIAFIAIGLLKVVFLMQFPTNITLSLLSIFNTLVYMSLFFGVLDLIPLPPFDGGRLLRYALPYSKQHIIQWLEQYSLIIFLFLFLVPGISDIFLGTIVYVSMMIKNVMLMAFF
jgi:Zn-dependent protease